MSDYWQALTPEDSLPLVLSRDEREAILRDDPDWTVSRGIIRRVSIRIREVISNNPANVLDPDPDSLPVTLHDTALDIIAVRLLKRYDLEITEARDKAADAAQAHLETIRSASYRVIHPDGSTPLPPSRRIHVTAPDPAYGSDGAGIYPTPRLR